MDEKMQSTVKKTELEQSLTCPLCTNLFDDATTISECLHTFCRKCIHDKFITERLHACPICNVDLGVFPLDKLRSDYSLQDLRLKLFPPKKESVKAGPETVVAASLKSSKKKKKSLTSLLASSPDAPLEPNVVVEEKQTEKVEARPHIQSSAKPIITFKKREKKASTLKKNDSELQSEQPNKETEVKEYQFDLNIEPDNGLDEAEDHDPIPVLADRCKSLSIDNEVAPPNINDTPMIVEPAITSNVITISGGDTEESVEPSHTNCVVNRETEDIPVHVNQNTVPISSDKDTEEVSGQKVNNNGNGKQERAATSRSRKKKGKRVVEKSKSYSLRPRKDGRTTNAAASESAPQVPISVEAEKKVEECNNPVWFSLMASRTQNKACRLPQIPVGSFRVKDRNMTVTYLKKYLKLKLGLESENQVEIWLRDNEPVSSSLTLHNLVDWWVQTTPLSERLSVMVGSSAADFLMVLYYSFKSK